MGLKKILFKKTYCQTKMGSKKISGSNKFWFHKDFGFDKKLCLKKLDPNQIWIWKNGVKKEF